MLIYEDNGQEQDVITLEEGRTAFSDRIQKYQFDEAAIEKLKDYYGYFWNRRKDKNIPQLYKNVFLFCESDIVGRSIYEACVECLAEQGLISGKEEIGYTYLNTEQDINEIKEMYAENAIQSPEIALKRKHFQSVIVAMPDMGEAKEELYQAGTSLFYREFRDHITCKISEAEVAFWELRKLLEKEQQFTEEFYEELQKYIQTVYPKREIENFEKFLQDACDRVRNKYYGKYESGMTGGADCVPDYQKIEKTVEKDSEIIIATVEKDPEIISAKEDIEESDLSGDIRHVLLLSMSTFPRGNKLGRNRYQYTEKDACYEVYGCGQLEPVPKLLGKKLESINEKLDLILIMASEETQKEEIIEVEELSDTSETETVWNVKKGTAVDFFKEQISKENTDVNFKVFECDADELAVSLEKVVGFIRKIKTYSPDLKLYLDIHGGLRQSQISIDAVMNLLAMEHIYIEDAFSIAGIQGGGNPTPILNVTNDMRIFDFVSGMNEFINYGRSSGLEKFFKNKNGIVDNIKRISNAIQICDIDRFLKESRKMQSSIAESNNNIKSTDQKLLDIFIENMKEDYGRLLEKNCTDLELLKWCGRKKFYQQALTVIESRIPGFLEGKIYTFEVEMKDENSNVLSRKKIMKRIKPRKWEKDCNYLLEQWCYQKIVKEGTDSDKFMELDKKGAQQFWNDMKESWNGDEKSKYEFQLEDPKFRQNSKIKKTSNLENIEESCSCKVKLNMNFSRGFTEEEERKFNIFMQLHMALKNQRNLVNHASEKGRTEPEDIFNAIEAYIEMVEYFVS